MQRFARIHDGIAVEIIELPDDVALVDAFHPDFVASLVSASPDVEVGWSFDGKTFSPPSEPSIDLLAYAADKRWQREISGVAITVAGEPVLVSTARGDDRSALHMTYTAIKDGLRSDGATFNFADSKPRRVSNAVMSEAILLALAHVQSAFDRGEEIYAAIEAGTLTSTAEIDAAFAA